MNAESLKQHKRPWKKAVSFVFIVAALTALLAHPAKAQQFELTCPAGTQVTQSGQTVNNATLKYRQWQCVDFFGNVSETTTTSGSGGIVVTSAGVVAPTPNVNDCATSAFFYGQDSAGTYRGRQTWDTTSTGTNPSGPYGAIIHCGKEAFSDGAVNLASIPGHGFGAWMFHHVSGTATNITSNDDAALTIFNAMSASETRSFQHIYGIYSELDLNGSPTNISCGATGGLPGCATFRGVSSDQLVGSPTNAVWLTGMMGVADRDSTHQFTNYVGGAFGSNQDVNSAITSNFYGALAANQCASTAATSGECSGFYAPGNSNHGTGLEAGFESADLGTLSNVYAVALKGVNAAGTPSSFSALVGPVVFGSIAHAPSTVQVQISAGSFELASVTFATLPASPNGSQIFCSDCNSTCTAGAGAGRTCFREGGAWTH